MRPTLHWPPAGMLARWLDDGEAYNESERLSRADAGRIAWLRSHPAPARPIGAGVRAREGAELARLGGAYLFCGVDCLEGGRRAESRCQRAWPELRR